ncbi:MAG: hypothetical protein EP300_13555 [Gammaproteobacteria bacterium]|nr:MAG: hypothetical protein EP300_13555 [Gammaproteobacteria bacterium]
MKYPEFAPLKSFLFALLLLLSSTTSANDVLKPFVLAAVIDAADITEVSRATREKLGNAGFEVIGEYAPYDDSNLLVFTSQSLRDLATRSTRGGYGAVLRASITLNEGKIELAYTNPAYWANTYRMQADVGPVAAQLKSALGHVTEFGSGDKKLTASDLRKYHYTFMMEYFDDPSLLNYFDSHEQAVATVRDNLAKGVAASRAVFELPLGADSEGKPMTLFGVGLAGADADDCSSDRYIMGRIDKDSPRHTAHLPYEILVYGDQAEALYGRFRIAISWPHLPMVASDTGATFFSIMCAPGAIENALMQVAGGSKVSSGSEK